MTRNRFYPNVLNSGIINKEKRKYPSIKVLEDFFHVIQDAQNKGISYRVQGDIVIIDFMDSRTGKEVYRELEFHQAAIFFKDILETY